MPSDSPSSQFTHPAFARIRASIAFSGNGFVTITIPGQKHTIAEDSALAVTSDEQNFESTPKRETRVRHPPIVYYDLQAYVRH